MRWDWLFRACDGCVEVYRYVDMYMCDWIIRIDIELESRLVHWRWQV